MKKKRSSSTAWGVFDTHDRLWIGNSKGPILFGDEMIAQIAAQMTEVQVGWDPGRARAREFVHPAGQRRDAVETKMGPEEALRIIEEGRDL